MNTKSKRPRLICLFLSLCMLLSLFNGTVTFAAGSDSHTAAELPGTALHFIIRHWHTETVTGTSYQGDSDDDFVVVEGYIVPAEDDNNKWPNGTSIGFPSGDTYHFYIVKQETGSTDADRVLVPITDPSNTAAASPYIQTIDSANGKITLRANPASDEDNEVLEKFSGFSISAGQGAVEYDDSDSDLVTIAYSDAVHLVKGHVFYINTNSTVSGTTDSDLFPTDNNGKMTKPEVDTMEVYVYAEDITETSDVDGNPTVKYQKGEIVKVDGKACGVGDALPDGVNETQVALTKFYSTTEGLHTDKTASTTDDDYENRTYTLDLEAWYAEGDAPVVGMVLDASGSMAFASDTPTPINVYQALTATQLAQIKDKIGVLEYSYVYPKYDKLIGYYPFTAMDASGTYTVTVVDKVVTVKDANGNDASDFIGFDMNLTSIGSSPQTFNDGSSTQLSEYVPFGGKTGTAATSRYISFLSTGATTVKVWWYNAGGATRGIQIWDENGGGVVDSDLQAPGGGYYTEWKFTGDGSTYKLVAVEGDIRIYKVEITVTAAYTGLENKASTTSATAVPQQSANSFSFDTASSVTTGYTISGDGKLVISGASTAGILLDAKPTSGNFTISFSVQVPSYGSENSPQSPADILYVGALAPADNSYFRGIRDGWATSNNRARFRGYQGNSTPTIIDLNSVFGTNAHRVTLVFSDGQVTPYVDNTVGNSGTITLSGYNIIFGGFLDGYNGADILIDDVFVYDTALTPDDVQTLVSAVISGAGVDDMKSYSVTWEDVFLTDTELAWLLNPRNTDNSLLGEGDYTYFVFDTADTTMEYAPLGYSSTYTGWVFVSHTSTWNIYTAGSGKDLRPVKDKGTHTDAVTLARDGDAGISTGVSWTASGEQAIKFYIDSAGYLRCFYNNGSSALCSYVYELTDSEYVKTEALQRALGDFVTKLGQRSPASLVSAVRFSTNDVPDDNLDKLVLLDWTNDAGESAGILSLKRGTGGTAVGTDSTYLPSLGISGLTAIQQYNYGLTGGTATYTGLQAFQTVLDSRLNTYLMETNTNAKKYLIVFTDGLNTHDPDTAKTTAQVLKNEGYTIFTVMLNGGPVEEGGSQYDQAYDFLTALSGAENFFSVSKARKDEISKALFDKAFDKLSEAEQGVVSQVISDKKVSQKTINDYSITDEQLAEVAKVLNQNATDLLTQIFSEEILSTIVSDLEDYTVEDYIDPRFDLVDADGCVWQLNGGGEVVVDGNHAGTHELTKTTGVKITLTADKDVDEAAQTAYLYYDATADMYYLDWVDQTIPSGCVGSTLVNRWNARITVKAKDDFIGGNAILTNGNAASMNWVYHPNDLSGSTVNADSEGNPFGRDASSGTDDMYREYNSGTATDAYPSKGFPRTTVNVKLQDLEIGKFEQIIYLGEEIEPDKLLEKLSKTITNGYYWAEYLTRYAKANEGTEAGKYSSLDALLKEIVKDTDGVWLPYSYLENADGTNQAGNTGQQDDILGQLHYKWELIDADTGEPITQYDGYGTDDDGKGLGPNQGDAYTTLDTRNVAYKLTVTYYPYPDPDTAVTDIPTTDGHGPSSAYTNWCSGTTDSKNKTTYRDIENADLITDAAYGNTSTASPKTAVGTAVYDKTVEGTYTTYIVRGELAFEMTLDLNELNYLFTRGSWTGKSSVDYVVNAKRAYGSESTTYPLKISIAKDDITKLKGATPDANGLVTLYYVKADTANGVSAQYPKAVYDSTTGQVTFYSDPTVFDEPTNGYAVMLPIGTYTLTPDDAANAAYWSMFDFADLTYVDQADYARAKNHFTDFATIPSDPANGPYADGTNSRDSVYYLPITRNTEELDPNYYATKGGGSGVVFQLGTDTSTASQGGSYLTQRVGMAKIDYAKLRYYEMPATGGPGTFLFYLLAALLLTPALGLAFLCCKRNRLFNQSKRLFVKINHNRSTKTDGHTGKA